MPETEEERVALAEQIRTAAVLVLDGSAYWVPVALLRAGVNNWQRSYVCAIQRSYILIGSGANAVSYGDDRYHRAAALFLLAELVLDEVCP